MRSPASWLRRLLDAMERLEAGQGEHHDLMPSIERGEARLGLERLGGLPLVAGPRTRRILKRINQLIQDVIPLAMKALAKPEPLATTSLVLVSDDGSTRSTSAHLQDCRGYGQDRRPPLPLRALTCREEQDDRPWRRGAGDASASFEDDYVISTGPYSTRYPCLSITEFLKN